MTIAVFSHPACLEHDTGPGHPKSAARLTAVLTALETGGIADRLEFIDAPPGTESDIVRVHTPEHYARIEQSVPPEGEHTLLDADTIMSHGSFQAALRAVGAACAAVDGVMRGDHTGAFCAIRPPGHHATPERTMGFCLFNNIAIAARHALGRHGLARVAIVDFDVHHGNGTQDAFERDPRVFYVSTHQWPHYPGTGRSEERGVGNLLNLPLPTGTAGAQYRAVFTARVIPALHNFRPQLILASAGFDAHGSDPLAGLRLTTDDYGWIGEQLAAVAAEHCGGKIVSVLEGGYDLKALAESAVSYLAAFARAEVSRVRL